MLVLLGLMERRIWWMQLYVIFLVSYVGCFRHLQQNFEMHLRDQHFPPSVVKKYTHHIFGWSETDELYHEGLVDCRDIESFNTCLETLKPKWDSLERYAFED